VKLVKYILRSLILTAILMGNACVAKYFNAFNDQVHQYRRVGKQIPGDLKLVLNDKGCVSTHEIILTEIKD
jgi:hypothetical protein